MINYGQLKEANQYQMTPADIEKIVYEYKNGQSREEAAQKLLDAFQPYYRKFLKILKRGICDMSDADTRYFLGLYIDDDETRNKFYSSWNTPWAKKVGNSRTSFLADLCKCIEYEELEQECKVILLMLADRYEQMDRTFLGYVSKVFRYELRRSLEALVTDPLVFLQDYNIPFDEAAMEDSDNADEFYFDEAMTYNEQTFTMDYTELGPDWISGLTCSEAFKNLTSVERKIICYYYLDKMTDQEIADRIGYHRVWVNKCRKVALEKLKSNINM